MCIIVFKPKKHAMPSTAFMQNCFTNNPNGAGFMYRVDNTIHIRKGFMTLDALLKALADTDVNFPLKRRDLVIHFRISTTGSTIPQNTHPFPLSNHVKDLKALSFDCDRAIAHNGILREYATFHNKKSDMSDTMYFAKMLCGINERFVQTILDKHAVGSRFVYMSGTKTINVGMKKLVSGTDKGLWVSNDSHEEYIYEPPTSIYRGAYDWTGWDRVHPQTTIVPQKQTAPKVNRATTSANAVYTSWVKDNTIKQTFHEYCDKLDTGMAKAWGGITQKEDAPKRRGDPDGFIYDLWCSVSTDMPYDRFVLWANEAAYTFDLPIRAESPISRTLSTTNPCYMAWFNFCADGKTFTGWCDEAEDMLIDAIIDHFSDPEDTPMLEPNDEQKLRRELIYAERSAALEDLKSETE